MPIDFNELDSAVHGPIRLGTMTALHMNGELDFSTLKKLLHVTDGSLGIHLQKLEEVGYIKSKKAFVRRRPKTTYRLTASGKKALRKYLESMQKLIDVIAKAKH